MSVKIFFCYAHVDEELLNKLKTQLKPLQRQGLIDLWYDREISAGTEWEREIKEQLNSAQIILLLVSPDFMASDYCYSIEMKRALERDERGEAKVIPVILRPVYWQGVLGKLQALPTDAKPVTDPDWHNMDRALFSVTEGIRKAIEKIAVSSPPLRPAPVERIPISRQPGYPVQIEAPIQSFAITNPPQLKQQQPVNQSQVSISPAENPKRVEELKPYLFSFFIGFGAGVLDAVLSVIFYYVTLPVSAIIYSSIITLIAGFVVGYITSYIFIKRGTGLLAGSTLGIFYLVVGTIFTILLGGYALLLLLTFVVTICCGLLGFLGAWFATRKHRNYVKPNKSNQSG